MVSVGHQGQATISVLNQSKRNHVNLLRKLKKTIDTFHDTFSGLCRGAIQSPALGSLGRYFISKRTVASSFAVSGASLGVLVIPLLLRFTLDEYGLPGATFVLGGFMLQGCIIGMALKPLVPVVVEVTANQELKEVQPKGQGEEEERLSIEQSEPAVVVSPPESSANWCCRLLHEIAFLLNPLLLRTLGAMFFCGMAYLNWYVFVAAYVKEIRLSKTDASLFVSLTGVTELVSRPIAGFLLAKFALNKTVLLAVFCCIALLVCVAFAFLPVWLDYDSGSIFWSFAVLSVILSITGGYFFALMMPLVVDAVAPKDLGRAVGMLPLVLGSGAAVGTQILSEYSPAVFVYLVPSRLSDGSRYRTHNVFLLQVLLRKRLAPSRLFSGVSDSATCRLSCYCSGTSYHIEEQSERADL